MRRSCGCPFGSAVLTSVDDGPPESAFNLSRIVDTFNRYGIEYLAIGGISGFLYGMVEYVTQDVDMMVKSTRENLELVLDALAELGAAFPLGMQADDLTVNTQWITPSGRIDILIAALGPKETVITFSELDRHAEAIEIERGLLVRTASLDDVIRMKEAADRWKDHQALPELRRLRGDPHPEFPRGFDPFKDFPIEPDEYDPD
jgi:hypothetical protein